MRKRPISVTLAENNLLWLRGRAAAGGFRSISDTLDRLVSERRTSGRFGDPSMRSVVGTIDIASSDPLLKHADTLLRNEFEASLRRRNTLRGRTAPRRAAAKAKSRGRR